MICQNIAVSVRFILDRMALSCVLSCAVGVMLGIVVVGSASAAEEPPGPAWISSEMPVTITATPKATADASKYTREYVIDVTKFKISNDGTHPVETSKGINAALQDARATGANRIVFPKGTYLISETDPIALDLKDTIIDLSGATLQINTNGLAKYSVVKFVHGAENLRLTNGTIRGDRDTHDYDTVKGTHEGGAGLSFEGGSNLEVDHLTFTNCTGDGAASGTGFTPSRLYYRVLIKDLEQGGFMADGTKADNAEKTRTIKPYDISVCGGAFEVGYTTGYQSFPYVNDRSYQAYFYDEDMAFIERKECLQFRKIEVPKDAQWMHLEFNQPEVKGSASGYCVRITNLLPSTDVHFHHNHLLNNRRLGMAYCGGQRWILEENLFEANGGTAPAYGIDFEDGWDLMQDVVFRNNKFKNNRAGDLVVCAGSEMIFDGNEFEKNVTVYGRAHNYTVKNNRFTGASVSFITRTGVASIHDNYYENCALSIRYERKGRNEGIYRKPGQPVRTPPLTLENETLVNVKPITGTYFDFAHSTLKGAHFVAGVDTSFIRFKNCELTDSSIVYEAEGPDIAVTMGDCKGTFAESGAGLTRRKAAHQ